MQHIFAGDGEMRNILLTLAYDGRNYHGWQIQSNAISVQQVFQSALENIIGDKYNVKGCSRTDTGVHANMYCVNILTEHKIPPERLKNAMNRFLPKDIVVLSGREAPLDFHARYSCKGKEYIYKIWNREERDPFLNDRALHYRYKLDEKMLDRAAKAFVGTHDFTSFCTLDKREKGDFTRTVKSFTVTRSGDMVEMRVEADGFLYNMVRIMVGTLLRVAQGKIKEDAIPDIIRAESRSAAGPTAPACGLYLNKVIY